MMVDLPWPPSRLSPNARVHWSARNRMAGSYKRDCYLLALAAKLKAPSTARIRVHLDFYPPDRRQRDDDNIEAAFKAGRDGLADAMRVNDHRFVVTRTIHAEPVKKGKVTATILHTAEDFTADELKAIANGPIMDVGNIYLPAGKVTLEEAKARAVRVG